MKVTPYTLASVSKHVNAAIVLFAAITFLLIPGGIVVYDLSDANIREGGIPRAAFRLHRHLTPRYERWARARIASGRAADLSTGDIAGTEWPLFGSVFYLWSTESLQDAWEANRGLSSRAPKDYAGGAVEAATQLVLDPHHAAWVKHHWGEAYLRREDVFYRMLLIAALTTHARLTGSDRHRAVLREQVEGLSRELDESPHGLLDDYPGQCYPGDVLTAIACIRRADAVLGTDHSAFARRALRGFEDERLDERGLPPYRASAASGRAMGPSRGCGNSYVCLFAPEIWPDAARRWYALYERHFWQHRWTAAGFREFPRERPGGDWYADVDAGPVLAGHGISACAFGVGAARVNGRFDHAYPLTAEMLALSWPMANGTLLAPRLLSSATDAPYLGEAAILFNLTRRPAPGFAVRTGGRLPPFVYLVLALTVGLGTLLILLTLRNLRTWRLRRSRLSIPAARAQFALWLVLMLGGMTMAVAVSRAVGLLLVLGAQLLPRGARLAGRAEDDSHADGAKPASAAPQRPARPSHSPG